jgi:hypothetical protein
MINLSDKSQPFLLQPPEEQTDNWDDDFEEGISFTKLQALDSKNPSESDKLHDDNSRTIKATKSPIGSGPIPLAQAPSSEIMDMPIIEDYSDMAEEGEEDEMESKILDFKVLIPLFLDRY